MKTCKILGTFAHFSKVFRKLERTPCFFHLQSDAIELRSRLDAGGKPSTWFPPGRLVELIYFPDSPSNRAGMGTGRATVFYRARKRSILEV